ncbi:uncharacterized protein BDV17DRAFT_208226 [Aspergillus undulatus]|uniref:uncharacterized protein n=1 Tax=Aspergillus undulatus TaxID=1810928 RepID=UPI003CCE181D
MSHPIYRKDSQKSLVGFGTTREHEFFKYLPPSTRTLQHVSRDTRCEDLTPHSSQDSSLAAFAQLGALRLDAQRTIISLFGRNEQHILTEATQTLSLRDGSNHKARDGLWVGTCTMSYNRSFCAAVANPVATSSQALASSVFTVPDLTERDAFKDHPDVTGYPNIRFLACAPIVSPKGIVIGAYTILDNKARGSLSPDQLGFLTDMAATVMDYLSTNRSRDQHHRGERMMVGLGSFLEGKGSLRSEWLDATEAVASPNQDDNIEGRANTKQQDKQRSNTTAQVTAQKIGESELSFRLHSEAALDPSAGNSWRQRSPLPIAEANRPRIKGKVSKHFGPSKATADREREKARPSSDRQDSTVQIQETFARAANIIRESVEVEGVVFFDAHFGSQEAFMTNAKFEQDSSLESSSSEAELRAGNTQLKTTKSAAESSAKESVIPCNILGFATSTAASVNDELTGDAKIAISESFLAGLLRRYPRGKIFNYGAEGGISSDDTGDGVKSFSARAGKKYKKTRKSVLHQDALTLLKLAPNSRSILFSPIWDSHKSRWFAGTLAWTKSPQRVFTVNDELAFCTAIGCSLIAEVHLLGSLFADRAKSDLLAGLSHELRSPLHGIFGTAELLGDTMMDALQRGFVHTIISCASTLLGTIDQLLEFSSINDIQKAQHPDLASSYSYLRKGGNISQISKVGSNPCVQLDAVVEDNIESIFAGFSFFHQSQSPLRGFTGTDPDQDKFLTLPGRVKIILDIGRTPNWKFSMRPGAWHIILTNIVGNALKYTKQGYIYVSINAEPILPKVNGEPLRSRVTLLVEDTGCGMDPEFLRDGYFISFSQEDDMLPGNGLGASITRKTVSSLSGDIQVRSQKGIGTQVMVDLTLDHLSDSAASERGVDSNPDSDIVASTRRLVHQRTIGILGFGTSKFEKAMSSSLRKICAEWLEMEVHLIAPSQTQFHHCDFYISLHEYLDMGGLKIRPIAPDSSAKFPSPVIVICASPKIAHSLFVAARHRGDSDVLEFITQPCGPRKLAKSLDICLSRQKRRISGVDTPGASIPPSLGWLRNPFLCTPSQERDRQLDTELVVDSKPVMSRGHPESQESPQGKPKSFPAAEDYFSAFTPTSATNQGAKGAEETNPDASTPAPTILLVDDNNINISLLVAFMRKLNLDYIAAQNGQEALDSFKKHSSQIRVVLMDISMPVMDGFESTRQIRAFENTLEKHERATVIALTGVAQADLQREAIGSGMDLFLTKPVRLNTLSNVITNHAGIDLPLPKDRSKAP